MSIIWSPTPNKQKTNFLRQQCLCMCWLFGCQIYNFMGILTFQHYHLDEDKKNLEFPFCQHPSCAPFLHPILESSLSPTSDNLAVFWGMFVRPSTLEAIRDLQIIASFTDAVCYFAFCLLALWFHSASFKAFYSPSISSIKNC